MPWCMTGVPDDVIAWAYKKVSRHLELQSRAPKPLEDLQFPAKFKFITLLRGQEYPPAYYVLLGSCPVSCDKGMQVV